MRKNSVKEKFRLIFENSPVAIWEEDISALKDLRKYLKDRTVTNAHKYLSEHKEVFFKTFSAVRILSANKAALAMCGAANKDQIIPGFAKNLTKEIFEAMVGKFVALLNGKPSFEAEIRGKNLKGKSYEVLFRVSVPEDCLKDFSRAIITLQDITEQKKMERHLRTLAQLDSLTKLYNHRTILARLDAEFLRAKRYGSSLSCMMIDVDHFKVINDEYGHQKGDQVIRRVANALRQSVRQVDVIGRYGGDEFLVILPETKAQNAKVAAARIQALFESKKFQVRSEKSISLALSIGISGYPAKDIKETKDLVAKADNAMYAAKKMGRNRIVIA